MSVIEYKEYEHGGGFVGFRVARTIGCESDYRQKYFSLKNYSYDQAKDMAQKLDKKWSMEAKRVLKTAVRKPYMRTNTGKHFIANGFRAFIETSDKVRATGEIKTYFSPCFVVNIPSSRGSFSFRTRKLGYENAYMEAVKKYSELHNLSKKETSALNKKLPPIELFTQYLLNKLRQRGHILSKKSLVELLNQNKTT